VSEIEDNIFHAGVIILLWVVQKMMLYQLDKNESYIELEPGSKHILTTK
jgi:hypothetical protein